MLNNKMKQVIAEMMKIENLCEADIFELCDKYELNHVEEMNVYNMFQKSLSKSITLAEALAEPERPKVPDVYAPNELTLTKGFGV